MYLPGEHSSQLGSYPEVFVPKAPTVMTEEQFLQTEKSHLPLVSTTWILPWWVSLVLPTFLVTQKYYFFPHFGLCKEGASFGLSHYKNTVLNSKMLPKVKVIKWLWLTELKRKLKEEPERGKTQFFCFIDSSTHPHLLPLWLCIT